MGGMVRRFLPDGDLDLAVLGNLEVADEPGAKTLKDLRPGRAKTRLRQAYVAASFKARYDGRPGPRQSVAAAGLGAAVALFVIPPSRAGFEPFSWGMAAPNVRTIP